MTARDVTQPDGHAFLIDVGHDPDQPSARKGDRPVRAFVEEPEWPAVVDSVAPGLQDGAGRRTRQLRELLSEQSAEPEFVPAYEVGDRGQVRVFGAKQPPKFGAEFRICSLQRGEPTSELFATGERHLSTSTNVVSSNYAVPGALQASIDVYFAVRFRFGVNGVADDQPPRSADAIESARDRLTSMREAPPEQWRTLIAEHLARAYTTGDIDELASTIQFMAYLLDGEGRFDDAVAEVHHALRLAHEPEPARVLLLVLLASLLAALGQHDGAVEADDDAAIAPP